ncbi:MAG: XdhC family protein, partial [Actinobacteria bacterium]|nr:XdhC family protein [Actinomycetota bacterium]
MLELAPELLSLLRAGAPVVVVTVTRVARSAPRGAGATMAVTADARVIGSISGGCVEGDAMMLALEILRTGEVRTASFGFNDDVAHAAGLACGGSVEVAAWAVDASDAVTLAALEAVAAGRSAVVGIVLNGSAKGRVLGRAEVDRAVASSHDSVSRAEALSRGESFMLTSAYDAADVLILAHARAPRLVALGAGQHAAALCRLASAAGFSVTVCDVWATLVTPERFPDATELVVALPHEYLASLAEDDIDARTAVCVLTHDERLDVPALRIALTLPVGFVGAMGARSTVARRAELLRQSGIDETSLARLHS